MVFDAESKAVLHTEMAKKNLFVKRGENATQFTFFFFARNVVHNRLSTLIGYVLRRLVSN